LLAAGVVAVGMLMMIPGRICACGGGHASQARLVAARTDMKNLETALDQFRADVGRYPMTAEGLVALRQAPAQSSNWHGPYIRAEEQPLIDPWEQLYVYRSPGEHNATSFDLTSCGPDRRLGTSDDIANWKQ
jgi:general secretion pathway protein G